MSGYRLWRRTLATSDGVGPLVIATTSGRAPSANLAPSIPDIRTQRFLAEIDDGVRPTCVQAPFRHGGGEVVATMLSAAGMVAAATTAPSNMRAGRPQLRYEIEPPTGRELRARLELMGLIGFWRGTPRLGLMSGHSVQDCGHPGDSISGSGKRIGFCLILPGRVVGDRRPHTHVLRVSPELLESERSLGPHEDIDTAIDGWRRRASQDRPGRIQAC